MDSSTPTSPRWPRGTGRGNKRTTVQGDRADIYISMQDLTGDRIDETMDLFDSYQINRPFDSSGACRLAGYDAQQKAAAFLPAGT